MAKKNDNSDTKDVRHGYLFLLGIVVSLITTAVMVGWFGGWGLGIGAFVFALLSFALWIYVEPVDPRTEKQARPMKNIKCVKCHYVQAVPVSETKYQCEQCGEPLKKRQRKGSKQGRIEILGAKNAVRVERAIAAVDQIVASEAARAGWLGDVNFTADLDGIIENLRKAHDLRKVADDLSCLDKPGADDRKILAEAKTTAANLERAAIERVDLIHQCEIEARLVDESLQKERDDARTAEQRAELHAKLSAMLYGIEANPSDTPKDSAADAVMARVQAYREIKNQIQCARDDQF